MINISQQSEGWNFDKFCFIFIERDRYFLREIYFINIGLEKFTRYFEDQSSLEMVLLPPWNCVVLTYVYEGNVFQMNKELGRLADEVAIREVELAELKAMKPAQNGLPPNEQHKVRKNTYHSTAYTFRFNNSNQIYKLRYVAEF